MRAVELFAGAGGLAMGTSLAGFSHDAVLEWDRFACDTIRENKRKGFHLVNNWPLTEGDVADYDFSSLGEDIALVAGGPPCQPFSIGGKARGEKDKRNMFPEVFRAVRETKPRAILVENVKGLTRRSFADYFQYIVLQLSYPEIVIKDGEIWSKHLTRLQKVHTGGKYDGLEYKVVARLMNAADYGVAQKRERVFFVGIRSDIGLEWSFPEPTHSQDALLRDQWVTGEYWDRHEVAKTSRPALPERMKNRINALRDTDEQISEQPWLTVRDVIHDLPDPKSSEAKQYSNHRSQTGARVYPGHTGSPLDEPAKTLKAGDHGVPGGENMLVHTNGKVRYFTVRESARLQSFPDDFVFHGSWTETMRQLGNAVPVLLAYNVARDIQGLLARHEERRAG